MSNLKSTTQLIIPILKSDQAGRPRKRIDNSTRESLVTLQEMQRYKAQVE